MVVTRRGGRMSRASVSRAGRLGKSEPRRFESGTCGFEAWSSQTNDFKMYTCHFKVWRLALLGYGKDWLARCQDNVTKWDVR